MFIKYPKQKDNLCNRIHYDPKNAEMFMFS